MSKKGGSAFDDIIGDDEDAEPESEQSMTEAEDAAADAQSVEKEIEQSAADSATDTPSAVEASSDVSSAANALETGPSLADSSPPFDFNDAEQDSMYPRQGTWDDISDFQYAIEGELREQYGIRNAEKRELHEAMLQLLLERIPSEVVARRIVEQRGFSPD